MVDFRKERVHVYPRAVDTSTEEKIPFNQAEISAMSC